MKTHFYLGILLLATVSSCGGHSSESANWSPYLGNIPYLEHKYAEDSEAVEEYYDKKVSSTKSEKVALSIIDEAEDKLRQLKQEFNDNITEQEVQLLGGTIPCTVIRPSDSEENGESGFLFTVNGDAALFEPFETSTTFAYMYHCDLTAQQDMYVGSYIMFDVFFVGDDYVQYGYLKQMLPCPKRRIQKGDVIPCRISIRNIGTEDPVELQQKCSRILLSFNP